MLFKLITNEVSEVTISLFQFMKRVSSSSDKVLNSGIKKHKDEKRIITKFNSKLRSEAKDRIVKSKMIKTSYEIELEYILSSIVIDPLLFAEKVKNLIISYLGFIFSNNEGEFNRVYLVENMNHGITFDFGEDKIVLSFEENNYIEKLWLKQFETIILVESAKSLTVKYEVPRRTRKLFLSSMTREMNGKSISIVDYINLTMDIVDIPLFLDRNKGINILGDISIKSIDISPNLDVVIYINADCLSYSF